jgi:hypothetical protein
VIDLQQPLLAPVVAGEGVDLPADLPVAAARLGQPAVDRRLVVGEVRVALEETAQRPAGHHPVQPRRLAGTGGGHVESPAADARGLALHPFWAKYDRSLVMQAAKLPHEEVTDERLHQAHELAMDLCRVADQAQKQAEAAEQVLRDFEPILTERQQAAAPARSA